MKHVMILCLGLSILQINAGSSEEQSKASNHLYFPIGLEHNSWSAERIIDGDTKTQIVIKYSDESKRKELLKKVIEQHQESVFTSKKRLQKISLSVLSNEELVPPLFETVEKPNITYYDTTNNKLFDEDSDYALNGTIFPLSPCCSLLMMGTGEPKKEDVKKCLSRENICALMKRGCYRLVAKSLEFYLPGLRALLIYDKEPESGSSTSSSSTDSDSDFDSYSDQSASDSDKKMSLSTSSSSSSSSN